MASYLFNMYRGDDYALKARVTDKNGNPVSVVDWVITTSLKLNFLEPDTKATVLVTSGPFSGTDAENGIFYVLLPHDQTEGLLPAPYFFDMQRELLGAVSTIIRGKVKVTGDVTHDHNSVTSPNEMQVIDLSLEVGSGSEVDLQISLESVSPEAVKFAIELEQSINGSLTNLIDVLRDEVIGKLGYRYNINNQTEDSYTLVLDDRGGLVRMLSTNPNQVIIPPDVTVDFPLGTIINIRQAGSGATSLVPFTGVTVNSAFIDLTTDGAHFGLGIVKVGPNEWDAIKSFVGVPTAEIDDSIDALNLAINGVTTSINSLNTSISVLDSKVDTNRTDMETAVAAALTQAGLAVSIADDAVALSDFGSVLAENGQQQLPGGLWFIWGTYAPGIIPAGNAFDLVFHQEFPNNCLNCVVGAAIGEVEGTQDSEGLAVVSMTKQKAVLRNAYNSFGDAGGTTAENSLRYFAIGN